MRWYWMLLLFAITAFALTSSDALLAVKRVLPGASMPAMVLWLPDLAVACVLAGLLLGTRTFGLLALGAGSLLLLPAYSWPLWRVAGPWLAAYRLHLDTLVSTALRDVGSTLSVEFNWLLALALCALLVADALMAGTKVE